MSFLWSAPPSFLEVWSWCFWQFRGRDCCGMAAWMDFFACNGRWWPWCGGADGIDGIVWPCHRLQVLLSSCTTFRRGWSIVFYNMSKFCWWWHFKILNDPSSTWCLFWKRNWRNKFLVLVVKTLFTTHSTSNREAIISKKRRWIQKKITFLNRAQQVLSGHIILWGSTVVFWR